MDCQNFADSRGRNFMGYWFVAIQYKTFFYRYFINRSWGHKFISKGNPQNFTNINPP